MLNYPNEILDISIWYENIIGDPRFSYSFTCTGVVHKDVILLKVPIFYDFLAIFIDIKLLYRFYYMTTFSIESYFIASFLGLFLNLFKRGKKNFIIFNVCVVIVLINNFLPFFISNLDFIDTFRYRTLETFALPIIIMATFFLEWVLEISKKITNYLLLKFKFYYYILNKYKPFSKILKIELILLLILFINSLNMKVTRGLPSYYYYYNDDYVEIILYIKGNLEPNSIICYPNLGRDDIHNIINNMEFYRYNISEFATIDLFYTFVVKNFARYFIFNNSEIPEIWKRHISYPSYTSGLLINTTQFSLYRVHGF
jgi:hypothetical protein